MVIWRVQQLIFNPIWYLAVIHPERMNPNAVGRWLVQEFGQYWDCSVNTGVRSCPSPWKDYSSLLVVSDYSTMNSPSSVRWFILWSVVDLVGGHISLLLVILVQWGKCILGIQELQQKQAGCSVLRLFFILFEQTNIFIHFKYPLKWINLINLKKIKQERVIEKER